MAHTTIVGTLGKGPSLQESQNGTLYTRLNVAWKEKYKDRTGDYVDGPTTWISVTVFGRQAQNVAASLTTGQQIVITGDMRTELWSSDQGEQAAVTINADIVSPTLFFQVAQVTKDDAGDPLDSPVGQA